MSEPGEATSYEGATDRAIAGAVEAALVDHATRSVCLNLRGIAQAGATLDMAESSRHSILTQIARTLALRNEPPAVLGEDLAWLAERANKGPVPSPGYDTRGSGPPADPLVKTNLEPFMPRGEWSRRDFIHYLVVATSMQSMGYEDPLRYLRADGQDERRLQKALGRSEEPSIGTTGPGKWRQADQRRSVPLSGNRFRGAVPSLAKTA